MSENLTSTDKGKTVTSEDIENFRRPLGRVEKIEEKIGQILMELMMVKARLKRLEIEREID